jgi:hypothetical protein
MTQRKKVFLKEERKIQDLIIDLTVSIKSG